jgi:hypothetical protein
MLKDWAEEPSDLEELDWVCETCGETLGEHYETERQLPDGGVVLDVICPGQEGS